MPKALAKYLLAFGSASEFGSLPYMEVPLHDFHDDHALLAIDFHHPTTILNVELIVVRGGELDAEV